ncbi:Imm26 family immunity protein [Neorhizobium petrolearium]|uniref:Imm26 family immunity protein n=1 Tax=Neorhizobium petrolearium TaxID=515361 RepID=UPI003F81AC71
MQRIRRGDVYKIKVDDQNWAYAVALKKPLYGFFDRLYKKDVPLAEAINVPFAFRCSVMDSAVKSGRWVKVGNYEPDVVHDHIVFFTQDKISGQLRSYVDGGAQEGRQLSPVEARKLEPAAVWSAEHVEDRLRDHFARRPNRWLISMMP